MVLIQFLLLFVCVFGQDPAGSWLGYAKAVKANNTDEIITRIDVYWKNANNPTRSGCRFCPWFGIESSDNENLIQPVNVWDNSGRDDWIIMNEYFQWHPSHDTQSKTVSTSSGDVIYSWIKYTTNAYLMHVENTRTKQYVETTIPVQEQNGKYKKYTIAYFVFEHPCNECSQYPPDNAVTFYNISIQYNNVLESKPVWTTGYKANKCNNRAKILSENSVEITWQS
eukprot:555908_1